MADHIGARRRHAPAGAMRILVVAVAVAVVAATGGCGIDATSTPTPVGTGLEGGLGQAPEQAEAPPGPDLAHTPRELVQSYFTAAAGFNLAAGADNAVRHVQEFLTPDAQRRWQPGQSQAMSVVRVRIDSTVTTGDTTQVKGIAVPVGTLDGSGTVEPPDSRDPISFSVDVVPAAGAPDHYRLDSAPTSGLAISDSALGDPRYYQQLPVYFWDSGRNALVADLRYLPLQVPAEQRPTQIVDYLLSGPSRWLSPAVHGFPPNSQRLGVVVRRDDGALVVNLSARTLGSNPQQNPQLLVDQLRWSLHAETDRPVVLQIEGQEPKNVDGASDGFLEDNLAAVLSPPTQTGYTITKGRLVPTAKVPVPPFLDTPDNQGVVAAALDRETQAAALVRVAAGRYELRIVRSSGVQNHPPRSSLAPFLPGSGTISRPAWVPGTEGQLLVARGPHLYTVAPSGQVNEVTPQGTNGAITSIAVATDGRRLALIAGGRAYAAPLIAGAATLSVGQAQQIPYGSTGPTDAVAIGWSTQYQLIVAAGPSGSESASGAGTMWEVSIDGAIAKKQPLKFSTGSGDYQPLSPTDLVAVPENPVSNTGEIMVQTKSGIYQYFHNTGTTSAGPSSLPVYPN